MRGATHPTTRGATPHHEGRHQNIKGIVWENIGHSLWRPSWWELAPLVVGDDTLHGGDGHPS